MESAFRVDLLRDAILWVEKEAHKPPRESSWDQGAWARFTSLEAQQEGNQCGTAFCVAGHLAHEAGLLEFIKDHDNPYIQGWDIRLDAAKVEAEFGLTKFQQNWVEVGSRILGIEWSEARRLFEGSNTAEAVRGIAEEIAAAHGEIL